MACGEVPFLSPAGLLSGCLPPNAPGPEDTLRDTAVTDIFFEWLFEEAPEGIVLADSQCQVLRTNRKFREIFQYTDAEVRGKNIDELVVLTPEEIQEAQEISRRTCAGERCAFSSTFRSRKDGSRVPVSLVVSPLETPRGRLYCAIYRDISSQCRTENSLHRRFALEKMLSRISARFLKDSSLDRAIQQALEDLGSFFGADRGYVFQIDPEGSTQSNTHEWCAPGVTPEKTHLQRIAMDATPWWIDTLRREGAILIHDVDFMPPEAALEQELLKSQGIRSLFVLGWTSGDTVEGYVGFDNTRHPGAWNQEDLEELKFFRDLLESALHKRATEQAWRRSEKRYEAVVQDQEDLVCRFAPDGRLRFANRAFFAFFGLDRGAINAFSVVRCVAPAHQEAFRADMDRITPENPRCLRMEEMSNLAGEPRWFQWSNVGIFDDRGLLQEIQGVGRDVTETMETEQALRESRDLLEERVEARTAELATINTELRRENSRRQRTEDALKAQIRYTEAILRTVPDTVLVFDQNGTVTDVVTHAAMALPHRLPPGRALEEFLPPETVPRVREAMGRTLELQTLQTVEYTDEQGRSFEARLAPLCRGEELCDRVVCLSVDITRRKEIEASLRSARDQAENANRTKAIFLANMSHEIRTPLNAVLGMARLLRDSPLSEDQRELLQHVLASGEKLLSLLNNLLTLARLETEGISPARKPLDLRALVRDAVADAESAFRRKGIALHSSLDHRIPEKVWGDGNLLRSCLDVLLHNAASFTSAGRVSLTVAQDRSEGTAPFWRFSVTDTGIGIATEDLQRIFEPFTQLDEGLNKRHQGAGTGLAITQKMVQAMGGHVSVESAPGQGSTFSFTLDLPPVSSPATPTSLLPSGMRVLLAEDNPVDRKLAQLMLRKEGVELCMVETGIQALEILDRETFDLAILDMQMPDMDGLETALRLRQREREQHRPALPLVAMTAFSQSGDPERCFAAGMDSFLGKPFTAETLRQALHTALEKHRPEG